jgi:hypothetical protein
MEKPHISTSNEAAHAVLRDTPEAHLTGVSANEQAEKYEFASDKLREEYIEGFDLNMRFIHTLKAFTQDYRNAQGKE